MKCFGFMRKLAAVLLLGTLLVCASAAEVPEDQLETVALNENNCRVQLSAEAFSYDGKTKEPVVSVYYGAVQLKRDADYTVAYQNHIQSGVAEAVVTGIGGYSGTLSRSYTITCPMPRLKSAANTVKGVQLRWEQVNGAQRYCVFRKTAIGTWKKIGITSQTSYLDQGVSSGKKYVYTVRCADQNGTKYVSGYDKAGVKISYLAAPVIRKTENLDGGIRLSWTKAAGAVKYRIFRKNGSKWVKLGDTSTTSFIDQKVKNGVRYTYTVRCISANGKTYTSSYVKEGKSAVYFAPPKMTKAANTGAGIAVKWEKTAGIDNYRIYRKIGSGKWEKLGDTKKTSWTDRNVTSGKKYTYTVRCLSSDGRQILSSYQVKGIGVIRLDTPGLINAVQKGKAVTVKWKTVSGAAGYQVYRKTDAGKWTKLAATKNNQYMDQSVKTGVQYTYTVRAYKDKILSSYQAAGIGIQISDPIQSVISHTRTAGKTTQIVLVNDHNLTLWEKSGAGIWEKTMDVYCGYGKNGLKLAEIRREGDKTTPIGSFPLTLAFGMGGNPGTGMDYRRITANSYWSSAQNSTYNTWVESANRINGEHLIDYYQYKYAMSIGFNMDPVVRNRGSAIFLHCKSTDHWYTAGCVSVKESDMLKLMKRLDQGAYMIIVPNESSISRY